MNLALAFAQAAAPRLDKTVVYWGDSEYSYRKLLRQSEAIAIR